MQKDKLIRLALWVLAVAAVMAHLVLPFVLPTPVSGDYECFLDPWMRAIQQGGGLAALADPFYNYAPAYMYFLVGLSSLGLTSIAYVRLVSAVFDFACAYWVGRLASHLGACDAMLRSFAFVPWLPTVLIESLYWGQCDAIYSSFAIASVYFILRDRPWTSMLMFGISLAFKAQCIFISPFFFVMMLKRRLAVWHLLAVVAVYVASVLPVWACGRPLLDLLRVYASQASFYDRLTMNCPNLYSWFEGLDVNVSLVRVVGCAVVACLALVMGFRLMRVRLSSVQSVLLALLSAVAVVFLLPGMHELYLFVGDLLAVAFWIHMQEWRSFAMAALVVGFSSLSYLLCTSASVFLWAPAISLLAIASFVYGVRMFKSLSCAKR